MLMFVLLSVFYSGGSLQRKLFRNALQEFCDHGKRHLHAVRSLGIDFKPKHHQLAHMINKLLNFGTPMLWGNWREETENNDIKSIARRTHNANWESRVLESHRRTFGVGSRRAARGQRAKPH